MKSAKDCLKANDYPMAMGSTTDRENLIKAMKEYGKGILDHLMSHPDKYIYVIDAPDEPTEAVFSYDAMEKLAKSLK